MSKIELVGTVGAVKRDRYGDRDGLIFSVCVNEVFDVGGESVIHTTWFLCTWWPLPDDCAEADGIVPGAEVHLEGRVASWVSVSKDGKEESNYRVYVQKVF